MRDTKIIVDLWGLTFQGSCKRELKDVKIVVDLWGLTFQGSCKRELRGRETERDERWELQERVERFVVYLWGLHGFMHSPCCRGVIACTS
eukprot:6463873-Amphidinium_carterae.1